MVYIFSLIFLLMVWICSTFLVHFATVVPDFVQFLVPWAKFVLPFFPWVLIPVVVACFIALFKNTSGHY